MNDMEALTPEEKKAKEKKEKRLKRKQARAEFRKGILAKVNRKEILLEKHNCGMLPSDYLTAFDLEGAGFSEDDIIEIGTVKTLKISGNDSATIDLDKGNYIMRITAVGTTEGTVKVNVGK